MGRARVRHAGDLGNGLMRSSIRGRRIDQRSGASRGGDDAPVRSVDADTATSSDAGDRKTPNDERITVLPMPVLRRGDILAFFDIGTSRDGGHAVARPLPWDRLRGLRVTWRNVVVGTGRRWCRRRTVHRDDDVPCHDIRTRFTMVELRGCQCVGFEQDPESRCGGVLQTISLLVVRCTMLKNRLGALRMSGLP